MVKPNNLSRREFIKNATLASAGVAATRPVSNLSLLLTDGVQAE